MTRNNIARNNSCGPDCVLRVSRRCNANNGNIGLRIKGLNKMHNPDALEIAAVIASQDIIECTKELNAFVNDEGLGVEISSLAIYCQKTGHKIAERDINSIFSFMKIRDKSEFVYNLFNATSLCVHPAWLETNGKDLDLLMANDPIGYACYCFGLITADYYQNAKNVNPKLETYAQRYWALARANALLTQRGQAGLTELNLELCRFLTYAKGAKGTEKYLFKRAQEMAQSPDMLAMLHVSGELTDLLHDCVNRTLNTIGAADRYIHATRFVDFSASPADAARGPSNIRKQRASKRDVKEQGMFGELKKLFENAGLEGMGVFASKIPTINKRADFSRFAAIAEDNEAKMIADLAAFGGTNLDLFGTADDGEEDDNEVIILRGEAVTKPVESPETIAETIETIPAETMNEIAAAVTNSVSQSEAIPTIQTPTQEPQVIKPMSALERARAKVQK